MIRHVLAAVAASFFGIASAQIDEEVIPALDPDCGAVDCAEESQDPAGSDLADVLPEMLAVGEALLVEPPYFNDAVSDRINVICPFKADLGYAPGEVTCGFIEVPENREDPESRTIRLLFAKIHAKASLEDYEADDDENLTYKDDPVAYLTGGPGVSIPTYVARVLEHDLVKERDLYVLQQRGIADSGAFCPFFGSIRPELNDAASTYEGELRQAERIKGCLLAAQSRGVDVSAYSTVENARDVRALRRALGFDAWNVWGISYGSHLGQMLAQVDPEGIKALVIDAIVPNDLGSLGQINRWVDRDLGLVFERCAETNNPHCDGLEERLYALLEKDPLTLQAADLELIPSGEVVVGGEIAGYLAFGLMYEQDNHPAIPAVVDQAVSIFEDPDIELLEKLTAAGGDGPFGVVSQGMSTAIRCNDGYYAQSAAEAAADVAAFPRFAERLQTVEGTAAMAQACIDGGAPLRDRADYQLVQSDLPTLIINGQWDPVTPPPLAERIVPGFTNGRYIEVPYAGHGPTRSMSECSGQVLGDFFDDPSQDLAALDATCFEEGVEPPKYLTYLTTTAPLKAFGYIATQEPEALVLPGSVLGFAALSSLLMIILMPMGFAARRLAGSGAAGLVPGDVTTRALALATALLTAGGLAMIGAGAAIAAETAELSLAIGVAQPGVFGAWAVLIGAVTGAALVIRTVMVRLREPMRTGTVVGFLLTGLSSASLAVLFSQWDLLPF
ncbi:MAG: alpha/beta hydrolase [Pseudomonadota bacterium]